MDIVPRVEMRPVESSRVEDGWNRLSFSSGKASPTRIAAAAAIVQHETGRRSILSSPEVWHGRAPQNENAGRASLAHPDIEYDAECLNHTLGQIFHIVVVRSQEPRTATPLFTSRPSLASNAPMSKKIRIFVIIQYWILTSYSYNECFGYRYIRDVET
jgi:hypothetical protein